MMRAVHHCRFPHNIFSSAALLIGVFRYIDIHLVTTFSRENLILLLLQSLRADPNLNRLRWKVWTQEYFISPIYSPTWQLYIIIPVLANCYNRTTLRPYFLSGVLNIHHHPNFQLLRGSFRAIKILSLATYPLLLPSINPVRLCLPFCRKTSVMCQHKRLQWMTIEFLCRTVPI